MCPYNTQFLGQSYPNPYPTRSLQLNRLIHFFCDIYCSTLASRIFASLLLACQLLYWYFAVVGAMNMSARLDSEKILPRGSPILEPHSIISHRVWTVYYPLTVIVNKPLDIRLKHQLSAFESMVGEFEALPQCKGMTIPSKVVHRPTHPPAFKFNKDF